MRMLDLHPTRFSFSCECGTRVDVVALDQLGEFREVQCNSCGRRWEHRLVQEDGDRGWKRTLIRGRARDTQTFREPG